MENRYLYKAKRIDGGEWVQGYYVKGSDMYGKATNVIFEPDAIFYSHGETDGLADIDPSTICQCTGLKDKNGKLIWENEIISFRRDNDDCPFQNKDTKKRVGKVFWQGFRADFAIGMGRYGSNSLNDDLWKYVQNGNRVEVMGNIFDNPELLDGKVNYD